MMALGYKTQTMLRSGLEMALCGRALERWDATRPGGIELAVTRRATDFGAAVGRNEYFQGRRGRLDGHPEERDRDRASPA